ncbi:hypothetical protein LZ198_40220 [Myxococcus sp. K15C18031901]|uniref:carboxylesterase family protein n=1 Tax=Myxococcus dinghuensis TaxID=2906761 RepID=UPI0020A77453|nr:hypothetical protein [Myxococcus dinghuensis]MCP3105112.1 hypothetical protein [Myxococcus dinghuensis]
MRTPHRIVLGLVLMTAQLALAAQGQILARPAGTVSGLSGRGYWEYLPQGYDDNAPATYPLVIFLGGVGQSGDGTLAGLEAVMNTTAPPKLVRNGRHFPFILLAPQHVSGWWAMGELDAFVEFAKSHYRVDTRRVYMTALSAGAFGVWEYTATYPNKLAAVVPIAGNGNVAHLCDMRYVPVWAFHGESDGQVSKWGSIDPWDTLNNVCNPKANPPAKLTLYPGVGHDSWSQTYSGSAGHDIYTWMLGYSR